MAPRVAATVQHKVPSTGPNSRPARMANVTPGSVSTTQPITVTAVYAKTAAAICSCAILPRNSSVSVPPTRADQPNTWLQANTARMITVNNTGFLIFFLLCFPLSFILCSLPCVSSHSLPAMPAHQHSNPRLRNLNQGHAPQYRTDEIVSPNLIR